MEPFGEPIVIMKLHPSPQNHKRLIASKQEPLEE